MTEDTHNYLIWIHGDQNEFDCMKDAYFSKNEISITIKKSHKEIIDGKETIVIDEFALNEVSVVP